MGTAALQTEMNPHIRREDALADPMLWAVKYRVHPKDDKKPFAFEREIKINNLGSKIVVPLRYQHEIYNALKRLPNLYMAIEKARQMRMSEWLVNTVFYICDTHKGVTILYILHDEKNGAKFVKKRIDPVIDDSPYLCKLISDVKQVQTLRTGRRKTPDSLALKRFGRCWFYMLHSTSDSASRSPDADIAIFDEYDAHNKTNETSFRKSCGDSDIKAFIYVSTPTLPDYGIDLKYKSTSMGQWTINCANCLQDFIMDSVYFFGDGVKVLEAPRWTDGAVRIFVCPHCGVEIKPADKQIRGRYVHAVPELIKENRLGFKFSNLILPNITADVAWSEYRECLMDPKGGGRKLYLNENLGEATMDEEAGARYTRDVMLECCDQNYGWVEAARNTYMGVDWGKDTHVIIWKRIETGIQLLNMIEFPSNAKPLENAKKVMELVPRFNPTKLICDFGAGQEQNKYLQERCPDIFWAAVNHEAMKDMNPRWNEKTRMVQYDLVTVYSALAYWFGAGMVKLPQIDAKLELFIQHCTNSMLIDPNKRPTIEGAIEHLSLVPKTLPKQIAKKGPIHYLSAALFGFIECMGSATDEFSCSDLKDIKMPDGFDPNKVRFTMDAFDSMGALNDIRSRKILCHRV